jgi:hypothetical protein
VFDWQCRQMRGVGLTTTAPGVPHPAVTWSVACSGRSGDGERPASSQHVLKLSVAPPTLVTWLSLPSIQ